ncbi:MAG: phenylalanine--tRNA ligase subunit beta [Muribaculaceae bacterium]|nr:phenylalanine--tRNA ligase subunit beta [Muribaculaceae bacterium]
MNISYNWLKEYINLTLSPQELAAALTSIGLETGSVEEVESIRGGLRGIVIGKVLTCTEHPDSDHLHITTVDLGDGQATQIVCGAPNVAAGQTVVVATVGTTLYNGDEEFKIKKSKIRGVESFGMICAEDEIGVGSSHDGIIVIDRDVNPGTPASEYFNLQSDYLLEVDLTPNRIDAASHFGVARDLSAWMAQHATAEPLIRPEAPAIVPVRKDGAAAVEVVDTEACIRYSGITIRGVKVQDSPQWLRDRLAAIGQRSINNIVDITNYILMGMGQPLHCFDLDKVKGDKIVVRTCPEGTKFTTLDGVERTLDSRDLMICNAEEPMCIAGVFGGLDSGVTEQTTSVFIESACFHPTSVRKTARRHGLNTDSSFRFERGVDPNGTEYMLRLATRLILELAGGEVCGEPVDIYPNPVKPAKVDLSYDYMTALVGKEIPRDTVDDILRSLEIEITGRPDSDTVALEIPTYRVDVTRPCDVVEDVLRIYGYNNVELTDTLHSSLSYNTATDTADNLQRLISEQLTAQGFNEIMNNSLTAEAYYASLTEYPLDHCVRLLNPLSNDLSVMRQSLIFGGLESLSHNINRKCADLKMYEFGNVYFFNPQAESTAEKPLAPYRQEAHLGIWMTGDCRSALWNAPAQEATVYDLKAIVENIFARLGISAREYASRQTDGGELFGAALEYTTRSGKPLATLGIVSKAILKQFDIKQPVCYADLAWDAIVKLVAKRSVTYTPLPKAQPVSRDLALLIDKSVSMAQVESVVRESERKLLKEIRLFDVYEGEHLPEGKKSYAIALTLQDDEKTMQDKQIEAVMNKIITNLKKKLSAELR